MLEKPDGSKKIFSNQGSFFELVSGSISLLAGLYTIIQQASQSLLIISFISIGLFFLARYRANKYIPTKDTLDTRILKYSKKQISAARWVKKLSPLLLAVPLFSLVHYFWTATQNKCKPSHQFALLVTNFSMAEDNFSYKLFNLLQASLENADSIDVVRLDKFINLYEPSYQDTLHGLFNQRCYNHGLLVFGKRSVVDSLFECTLYLKNLKDQINNKGAQGNSIHVQNPDLLNFSMEYQSEIISEFVLGVILYNARHLPEAIEKFDLTVKKNNNKKNKKLNAYCNLFMGNGFLTEGKAQEAVPLFEKGIASDTSNSFLHYGLGNALLYLGDSVKAVGHFELAHQLNNSLVNPIPNQYQVIARPHSPATTVEPGKKPSTDQIDNKNTDEGAINSTQQEVNSDYTVIVLKKRYGVINQQNDTIVRCLYDYIDQYIYVYKNKRYFIVMKDEKYGAINLQGKFEVVVDMNSPKEVKEKVQSTIP